MLKILKKLDDIFEFLAGWIMTLTGIATCTFIVVAGCMRYFLKMDFYGYEELTLFCAFWLYFIEKLKSVQLADKRRILYGKILLQHIQ